MAAGYGPKGNAGIPLGHVTQEISWVDRALFIYQLKRFYLEFSSVDYAAHGCGDAVLFLTPKITQKPLETIEVFTAILLQ